MSARDRPARQGGRVALRVGVAVTGSVLLVGWLLPLVTGTPWSAIGAALGAATGLQLSLLGVLWLTGLVVHGRVLTAAMPGLTLRRALTLNLTGSAVSNVVPLGGGVGVGLNYLMARRWGFSPGQFSRFAGLVQAWHLLAKALLPAAAVGLLIADNMLLGGALLTGAVVTSAILLALVAAVSATLLTRRGGRVTGRAADALLRLARRRSSVPVAARLEAMRTGSRELIRSAWRPMTWALACSLALQCLLLGACLAVVGVYIPVTAVIAVFAVERAATALPLTPGGVGVVEVAATAGVVALGGAPAAAAAGILLYRAFVFGLEIPVGGTWLACWWFVQRGRASVPA